ncbi:MAG: hypothetical protein M1819_004946 [Sarea resinae]|nr:MAG: hypothetical protein M1819_004946 [Sarea resinae]
MATRNTIDDMEILVHVAAPSGARDDRRYHALSTAYLDFEADVVHPVELQARRTEESRTLAARKNDEGSAPLMSNGAMSANTGFLSPSQGPGLYTTPRKLKSTSNSWKTPPSVVSDSQKSAAEAGLHPHHGQEQREAHREQASQVSEPWSSLLQSPLLTFATQKRSRQSSLEQGSESQGPRSPSPAKRYKAATVERTAKEADEHQRKPASTSRASSLGLTAPLSIPSSAIPSPAIPSSPRQRRPQSPLPPPHLSLPLEIHPPPPATSTTGYTTHITPTLSLLALKLSLPSRFNPAHISRPLRPLERGHWRLDTTAWDNDLRAKSWAFLTDIVGSGRAGWGVWCQWERDARPVVEDGARGREREEVGEESDERAGQEQDQGQKQELEILKLYTWGEIAPHAYLLLYLASQRRVKGAAAVWLDAEDTVVIRMPGPSPSSPSSSFSVAPRAAELEPVGS